MSLKTIGITGNRPEKLPQKSVITLQLLLREKIESFKNNGGELLLHGGARGVDMWAAQAAIAAEIKVNTYRPFPSQTKRGGPWSAEEVRSYGEILDYSSSVLTFSKEFSNNAYFARNQAIVKDCDMLLAVTSWDCSGGGAFFTKNYAVKNNVDLIELIVFNDRIDVVYKGKVAESRYFEEN